MESRMKTGRDRVWRENVEELKNQIQIGDVLGGKGISHKDADLHGDSN